MKLKDLTALLIELPTLPTVAGVAQAAGVGEETVLAAAREGQKLGYVDLRDMPGFGKVVSLTPHGADREGVVLIDVRIRSEDGHWKEEPRWLPQSFAWWLLEDAARIGYPVLSERDEDDEHEYDRGMQGADPNQLEPLEYLILSEEAEKRRAVDGSVLPYPIHFYGLSAQWPLSFPNEPGLDEKKGLAGNGTDGICPVCHNDMADPVGYCDWCDSYGLEAKLPRVTKRPPAHRAQLNPRCTLAGGRGPSKTVQKFLDRNKGKGKRAG